MAVDTHSALMHLANEQIALRYRMDLLEQVVLRLLRELAATDAAAAARIAEQVRRRAMEKGNRRQAPEELQGQIEMLELLNNVLAAAGLPPEPPATG